MFDPTPGDLFVQAGSFNAEIISGLCVQVTSYIKQLISNQAGNGDSGDVSLSFETRKTLSPHLKSNCRLGFLKKGAGKTSNCWENQ